MMKRGTTSRSLWRAGGFVSAIAIGFALACAVPPAPPALPAIRHEGPIRIEIEAPQPGARLQLRTPRLPVLGWARFPDRPSPDRIDLFVLLDVSDATRNPSGLDVDGDGEVGFDPHRYLSDLGPDDLRCTDPEDSVLHAEVAGVRRLLDHLSEPAQRVGLAFFGENARGEPETLPLGSDFSALRRALDETLAGERRAASLREAKRVAMRALRGGRPSSRRTLLVLHGGRGGSRAPETAKSRHGIERLAFSFTGSAGMGPAGDDLRSVQRPLDLLAWLGDEDTSARSVRIRNQTMRAATPDVFLGRDGRLSGWIPVQEGRNHIRVSVQQGEGEVSAARFRLDVERAPVPSHSELQQRLEEILGSNHELLLLIEKPVLPGKPGDLEIHVDPTH